MKEHLAEGEYYGCCKVARKANFLVLSEYSYAPRLQIPKHAHENPYFIFALTGSQEETFGGAVRTYSPSTLAFHPAGEIHSEQLGTNGMRCLHVEFPLEWFARHAEISRFLQDPSHFHGGKLGWLASTVYREFISMDDVSATAIEGLVLEILAEASRIRRQGLPTQTRSGRLAAAKDLIHARFAEPLSLADVAAAVGVHPVSLARAFRQQYQCSVGEFIRNVRIGAACRTMLSQEQLPLAEVALAVGFADQAHFTRTFRRIVGQTPGQYRSTRQRR